MRADESRTFSSHCAVGANPYFSPTLSDGKLSKVHIPSSARAEAAIRRVATIKRFMDWGPGTRTVAPSIARGRSALQRAKPAFRDPTPGQPASSGSAPASLDGARSPASIIRAGRSGTVAALARKGPLSSLSRSFQAM